MKRLGLIDSDNKPTQLANDWRLDEKYKASCDEMVRNVYPQELLELFPDSNFDKQSVVSWFMGHGVGSGAAVKMTALYSLLISGELKDVKNIKAAGEKKPLAQKTQKNSTKQYDTPITTKNTFIPPQGISEKRPNLHIDLQIHISPESSPEQIETIFASMAKYLYGENS